MTPDEYIARAATARVIYVTLFNTAMGVLPPLGDADIECHFTAKDLANRFEAQSVSMIRNELTWMVNWGWIENRPRSVRFLGRRVGDVLYLKSDLHAREATGEARLISRRILDIKTDAPPVTEDHLRRGALRQWRGSETTSGGALDLGS
jgi:hypothetical protein